MTCARGLRSLSGPTPASKAVVPRSRWRIASSPPRSRSGLGKKDYRSIVAVPITKEGAAYGSLAVDCGSTFAFYGYKKQIAYQLRPYISLLALTFVKGETTIPCLFEVAHVR